MGSFKFSTVVCKGALGIDEGYLGQSIASSPVLNRAAAPCCREFMVHVVRVVVIDMELNINQ